MISHRKYLAVLAAAFAAVWVALGVEPRYREDWALENALVVAFAVGIAASHRKLLLSRVSYTLIFAFLCLHEVGAHFTYAEVPYDEWIGRLTGGSLNELMGWERNHFDRLAHFSYGLLMAYPLREFFLRVADVKGFWGYFLPLEFTIATSALFELFEWAAAELFGGELGAAYLGTQGDVWDAHKDMALASLGALIAMIATSALFELFEWGAAEVFGGELGAVYLGTQGDVWDAHKDMALASLGALIAMIATAAINAYLQQDFARELQRSLRVKASLPLGEDEIARLHRTRKLRD